MGKSDKDSEVDSIQENLKKSLKSKKLRKINQNKIVSSSDTDNEIMPNCQSTKNVKASKPDLLTKKRRKRKVPLKDSEIDQTENNTLSRNNSQKKVKNTKVKSRKFNNSATLATQEDETAQDNLFNPKKYWLKCSSLSSDASNHSDEHLLNDKNLTLTNNSEQNEIDSKSLKAPLMSMVITNKLGLKKGTLKRKSENHKLKKV